MTLRIEGVITALVTPFVKGQVDYEGLAQNIAFQIAEGVSGILPLGTTGETPTLSEQERAKIIQLAAEQARGKALLMVGTGSNCTARTIHNTKLAKDLGADAALIVTPYYNKPTPEGIFRHYEAISEAVDLPIVVYNIAGRTGVNIETTTMKRLSSLPNIIAVKEASGNINQIGDVIHEVQNKHGNFTVVSGDDAMTLPLMALGGHGVISVVSNLTPRHIVAMVKAAAKGDYARARLMHFELLPLFKGAFIETNPIPIKAAMQMCGMPAGTCRLPLCELQPAHKEQLRKILEELGLLK
ncbi:MAG: 4-hydroxy-tetrahydrodipicolinate synthase [Deltaproteobacteria bacterium]|nr:4-hydroxy-tetrahydrodipicolinate synthase [Deltaproteobacteria bacterium]